MKTVAKLFLASNTYECMLIILEKRIKTVCSTMVSTKMQFCQKDVFISNMEYVSKIII